MTSLVRSWESILRHYQGFPQAGPQLVGLIELCSRVCESRLSGVLFAWTSVAELRVVSVPVEYPYDGPYLSAIESSGVVHLRYVDTTARSRQWNRSVQSGEAYSALESFCRDIGWVAK